CSTPDKCGDERLWVGESGEKLSSIIQGLISYGEIIPDLDAKDFSKLLSKLMRDQVVRPRYGTHPQLSILGPLEARLLSADRIILGGLNEGVWPVLSKTDPFLSRGMRGAVGLSLPERRFGLAAHDFAELATCSDVIITRSITSEGSPNIASRWLWRLQALMNGALGKKATELLYTSDHYIEWSRGLDAVSLEEYNDSQISEPTPSPELMNRWPNERKLSVTSITKMIRDPYSIYARYILNLAPLEALNMDIGSREYGTAMHDGLENFFEIHKEKLPINAIELLSHELNKSQTEAGFNDNEIYRNKISTEKIAANIISWMQSKFSAGWSIVANEKKTELLFKKLDFTLTAKVDLIMKNENEYAIIDYKTGEPPSAKEVNAGFDPQLPLSGYLLNKGAFIDIGPVTVTKLDYVRVKAKLGAKGVETQLGVKKGSLTIDELISDGAHNLEKLVTEFDKRETIYYCQPRLKYTYDYSDYDHLARRNEWVRLASDVDA
ncbi:MAG: PD-(D/E)XK nuclease family protein, partial [Hellea sp.]|nr:PD-(D/E)XK nuclease family protein [Hellea sp.]